MDWSPSSIVETFCVHGVRRDLHTLLRYDVKSTVVSIIVILLILLLCFHGAKMVGALAERFTLFKEGRCRRIVRTARHLGQRRALSFTCGEDSARTIAEIVANTHGQPPTLRAIDAVIAYKKENSHWKGDCENPGGRPEALDANQKKLPLRFVIPYMTHD